MKPNAKSSTRFFFPKIMSYFVFMLFYRLNLMDFEKYFFHRIVADFFSRQRGNSSHKVKRTFIEQYKNITASKIDGVRFTNIYTLKNIALKCVFYPFPLYLKVPIQNSP